MAPERQLLYQVGVSTAVLPLLSLARGEHWGFAFSAFATGPLLVQALVAAGIALVNRRPAGAL